MADELPLATHRAICKGKGVEFPLKDFPINCEGLQFPILELFSSVERTLVWDGDFELESLSSPHQLCDLGRVLSIMRSQFSHLKTGSWAS